MKQIEKKAADPNLGKKLLNVGSQKGAASNIMYNMKTHNTAGNASFRILHASGAWTWNPLGKWVSAMVAEKLRAHKMICKDTEGLIRDLEEVELEGDEAALRAADEVHGRRAVTRGEGRAHHVAHALSSTARPAKSARWTGSPVRTSVSARAGAGSPRPVAGRRPATLLASGPQPTATHATRRRGRNGDTDRGKERRAYTRGEAGALPKMRGAVRMKGRSAGSRYVSRRLPPPCP